MVIAVDVSPTQDINSLEGIIVAAELSPLQSELLTRLTQDLRTQARYEEWLGGTTYQLLDQFYEIDLHELQFHRQQGKPCWDTLYGRQRAAIWAINASNKIDSVRLVIRPYQLETDYSQIKRFCTSLQEMKMPYTLQVFPIAVTHGEYRNY